MKHVYRLVVFDWEGTLSDAFGPILNTLTVEAARLQLPPFDETLARQHVQLGLPAALNVVYPSLTSHDKACLVHAVHEVSTLRRFDIYLFPGASALLERLHQAGILLAIATNKGQHSLHRALQASGLDALFTVTRSAGQVPAKPAPQMLQEIMDVCAVNSDETLMIGDSIADMEMALSLSVDAVGVDFYHQQGVYLKESGALDVFDNYEQVGIFLGFKP